MPSAIWSSVATQPKPHRQACARDSIHFKGGKSADASFAEPVRRSQLVTLSAFSRGECSGQQALCGDGCSGPSAERTGAKLLETAELSLCRHRPASLDHHKHRRGLGRSRPSRHSRLEMRSAVQGGGKRRGQALDWRIGRNPKAISPLMPAGRNNSCLDGDFPPSSLGPPKRTPKKPRNKVCPPSPLGASSFLRIRFLR